MSEEQVKYIKSIQIHKLWGNVDIDWQLDPKVNILVGKNGVGKTTLLNIIESVINNEHSDYDFEIDSLTINFNISDTNNNLSESINLSKINTFEMLLTDIKQKRNSPHIKTELDFILSELINDFKSYQLKLKKEIESKIIEQDQQIKKIASQESATNQELQKLRQLLKEKDDTNTNINHFKNLFLGLINELFAETDKKIDFDKNNSIIFRESNDDVISAYQLSSGEKQILIILLNILLQENKPYIVLMDEPELSLHLSWQFKLIDMIQQLNPNCQLIIVTHASGICSQGWKDKVIKMEDIIQDSISIR